jgi:DnaJ-domain-containing protein 1
MTGAVVLLLVVLVVVGGFVALGGGSKPKQPTRVALRCPHCDRANVELAVEIGYIRGLLFVCRYGSRVEIGCGACVRRRVGEAAVRNLLFGWWCVPWGIATPFVVIQNLAMLCVRPPGKLADALKRAGLALDDVVIEPDGLTGKQRRFVVSLCACIARLTLAGSREQIRRNGADIVSSFTDGIVTAERALRFIDSSTGPIASPADDLDRRLALLQATVGVARSVGDVSAAMLTTLELIAGELGVPVAVLHHMLGIESDSSTDGPGRNEVEAAAELLGVDVRAPLTEVRSRYHALLVKCHPDHAEAAGIDVVEATRRTQAINAAYKTLVRAAQAPVS